MTQLCRSRVAPPASPQFKLIQGFLPGFTASRLNIMLEGKIESRLILLLEDSSTERSLRGNRRWKELIVDHVTTLNTAVKPVT
jgi:hypothetical protein